MDEKRLRLLETLAVDGTIALHRQHASAGHYSRWPNWAHCQHPYCMRAQFALEDPPADDESVAVFRKLKATIPQTPDEMQGWLALLLNAQEAVENLGLAVVLQRRGEPPRQYREITVWFKDGTAWKLKMEPRV